MAGDGEILMKFNRCRSNNGPKLISIHIFICLKSKERATGSTIGLSRENLKAEKNVEISRKIIMCLFNSTYIIISMMDLIQFKK